MNIRIILAVLAAAALFAAVLGTANGAVGKRYVGSEECAQCHPTEYESYSKYSKKAHSSRSVQLMSSDLTQSELESCFGCHTTGYGEPGGFEGFEETPGMADLGCETCHGPGSAHAEMGDPVEIRADLDASDCETCHNEQRVSSFNFKPLLFGGAH
jgi:hypothetical protein